MRSITLEQLADILEVMTVTLTIDSGFAITHHSSRSCRWAADYYYFNLPG